METDRPRTFIAIPGIWTDTWFDAPDAWWAWVCAWSGWSLHEWGRFRAEWARRSGTGREALTLATGIRFFDWRQLPGGSTWGAIDGAVALLEHQLHRLAPGTDVTLVGHSKGGNVIKGLLYARSAPRHADVPPMTTCATPEDPQLTPARSLITMRAAIICAPVDALREHIGAVLGIGIRPIQWHGAPASVRVATITNQYDPSGGRLRGVPNYHVRLWNDHFVPWPPHGMKSGLARQVLADLGAFANPFAPVAPDLVVPPSSKA